MKAIAKLKDDARKHEQKEEWEKAVHAYLQVIQLGEQSEDSTELELPLYNRVGDLYVRLGKSADAVKYYEQAADRYAEAGLYNNAIALCNKALRYDAGRLEVLRKLGMFSASQGFLTDARRWYLDYAEKAIKRGQLDDAFSALRDYAAVNDEPEIRELLARRMRDNGRKEQAVEEFKRAYALRTAAGQTEEAEAVHAELIALDPDADVTTAATTQTGTQAHGYRSQEQLPGYDSPSPAAPSEPSGPTEPEAAEPEAEEPEAESGVVADGLEIEQTGLGGLDRVEANADYPDLEIESGSGRLDAPDDSEVETIDIGLEESMGVTPDEIEEETASFDLPTFDDAATEEPPADEEEEAVSLPGFEDFDEAVEEEEAVAELPGFDDTDDVDPLPGFDDTPSDLPVFEPAARAPEPATTAPAPLTPLASKPRGDYIDLAALLGPDEDEAEESTRFVVAEKPPTGDEEQDFADMLAQFKEKVAESIPSEDAGSHYDLGIAFKEMGLIDEAISEFQIALRGGQERLKVYEELGSCFVMKGQFSVAITILNRAQQMPHKDDQELLGVYYNLGRAYEELGQRAEAKAAYEKIVAIDIGFQDTTVRLARL